MACYTLDIREDERDYSVNLGRDASTATRGFWIPWAERIGISLDFLGGHQADGFHMPRVHLDYPCLAVERVEMRPITPDLLSGALVQEDTVVRSDEGKMLVHYKNYILTQASSSSSSCKEAFGDITMEYSAEMLTLKSSRWLWNGGDKNNQDLNDSEITPFKLMPLKTVVLKLHDNQFIDTDQLNCSVGKVNRDDFAGHECETLLLLGARTTNMVSLTGIQYELGEIRFAHKKTGWNKFWDGNAFTKIHNKKFDARQSLCGTRDNTLVYQTFLVDDVLKKHTVL